MQLVEKDTNRCLLEKIEYAVDIKSRLLGLIGRSGIEEGWGLYFPRCSSIHTCFMRFPIDIIYINTGWKVVKTVEFKKPWRFSFCPGAAGTIETKGGWIRESGICRGMELEIQQREK